MSLSSKLSSYSLVLVTVLIAGRPAIAAAEHENVVRSAGNGAWSAAATWEGGVVPTAGARVLVRPGHRVDYDVDTDAVLRSVHVGGILRFSRDRNTRLNVGLLMIRPGESLSDDGIDSAAHGHTHGDHGSTPTGDRPVVQIGSPGNPLPANVRAQIQLTYVPGTDEKTWPALICSGGRLDLHGSPMARTWVKLGSAAKVGDGTVTLESPVDGWRVGDNVIVVTTAMIGLFDNRTTGQIGSVRDNSQTEERTIKAIDGAVLTLDKPLAYDHTVDGEYRGEVANLSRNVVVSSADPKAPRGHTMYHKGSAGSISYAEFRHLGKEGVLGRYPIHFHQVGDSMRGSSIVGASVWDSGNRWVTVHGTDYLLIRDVVGYQAMGHGFFLEDGSEVFNIFDRNLAVQALRAKPLPDQLLPFDKNDGAGFWWANSLNTFTRNVAAECDQHGYRYEVVKDATFDPKLHVRQPDGSRMLVDVRTLPFVRFDDNEAHSQRRFGLNLGGIRAVAGSDDYKQPLKPGAREGEYSGPVVLDDEKVKRGDVGGVGPDRQHPFVIRNLKVWTSHWAFHGGTPSVFIDGLKIYDSNYGIWRSRVDLNEYRNVSITKTRRVDIFYPWGGNQSIEDDYSRTLRPVDDLPPFTVITDTTRTTAGDLVVRGTSSDNRNIKAVAVNGKPVKATTTNYGDWEVTFSGGDAQVAELKAVATDEAGNVERSPHVLKLVTAPVQAHAGH